MKIKTKKIITGILAVSLFFGMTAAADLNTEKYINTAFARGNDIKDTESSEFVIGDIDCNGKAELTDLTILSVFLLDKDKTNMKNFDAADVNADDTVDLADLPYFKQYLSKDPNVPYLGKIKNDTDNSGNTGSAKSDVKDYLTFFENNVDDFLLYSAPIDDNKPNINPVCSPASIYTAMSITAECANSNTQNEILKALETDSISSLKKTNSELFKGIFMDENSSYCRSAYSLWLNSQGNEFSDDTLSILKNDYNTAVNKRNFYDSDAVSDEISEWIFNNTDGKIKTKKTVSPDDALCIYNTITFADQWLNEFEKTYSDDFTTAEGKTEKCTYMNQVTLDKVGVSDKFMKYSKPMNNNYNMNFVLPNENVSVDEILGDPEAMRSLINDTVSYREYYISLSVPKFSVCSGYDLVGTFKNLGVNEAFSGGDFSNILKNDGTLLIRSIDHEAAVQIDEKGCEAAVYTEVVLVSGDDRYPQLKQFKCSKPFFYYITDGDGIPVFAGIINDPSQN